VSRARLAPLLALGVVFTALTVSSPSRAAPSIELPGDVRLREGFVVGAPTGLEARLIADAADGAFNDVDVLTAALVASGVPDARVPAVRARVAAALDLARAAARGGATDQERGDRLLRALHGTVLRRYAETQSRVDVAVDTGEFNCLSSAVLFVVAADGLLPRPRGMISRTHAFARVDVAGRVADVETTTAEGFGVDREKLVTPAYLKRLGVGDGMSDAERAADLKNPEEVGAPGLVAGLYSNRGVLLVREGDLEGAAIAFDRATRLSRGAQQARVAEWRAALLNNATQGLLDAGRLDDARALLALALSGVLEGDTRAALLRNTASVAVAQGERAAARGDDVAARAFFDEALRSGGLIPSAVPPVQARIAALDGRIAVTRGVDETCATQPSSSAQARCLASAAQRWLEQKQPSRALAAARRAQDVGVVDDPNLSDLVAGALYNALVASLDAADAAGDCGRVEMLAREAQRVVRTLKTPLRFPADNAMGSCWWGLGDRAAKAGNRALAVEHYERARVHLPDDEGLRDNITGIDVGRAVELVNAGRCDEARPLIARAASLAGAGVARRDELLEACANTRAGSAAAQKDWAAAVVELRRGLIDVPGSRVLRDNLGAMLHNIALGHVAARRCSEARALVDELGRLGRSTGVAAIERACPASG
jgi:tetratricopeptide (TPR) repeat protein